ncbi:NAD-dependent epimerase/dehydratase family protein [Alkalihalobacterium bogoriense]|uniref:NAD-dependent epimerase/dehydratase family protein n=1 Tax=Alkalihalobacterium bogoriense TaxID=246272 RepID=UPI00047A7315|nr:NAD(P)-dependent oxidoreductase [Alkalihalobacterium bogoriense]
MKTVVMVGGSGTIGQILTNGLSEKYDVIIMDKKKPIGMKATFISVDATDRKDIEAKMPKADVLINLLNTETSHSISDVDTFERMTDIFFKASYYLFYTAKQKGIPKVIFASSNHVTDVYELDGVSLLGREITTDDVPRSKGVYGVLKYASEQLGYLFSTEENLSVMNIRIGSVPKGVTKEEVESNERLQKTLLSQTDVVGLFTAAIDSDQSFGTYYGVSDNPGKPWDMALAKKELGFVSHENTTDILQ